MRETWKMSPSFCSDSFVPGINRRSMMALVMDSTMRSVAPDAAGAAGTGSGTGWGATTALRDERRWVTMSEGGVEFSVR